MVGVACGTVCSVHKQPFYSATYTALSAAAAALSLSMWLSHRRLRFAEW